MSVFSSPQRTQLLPVHRTRSASAWSGVCLNVSFLACEPSKRRRRGFILSSFVAFTHLAVEFRLLFCFNEFHAKIHCRAVHMSLFFCVFASLLSFNDSLINKANSRQHGKAMMTTTRRRRDEDIEDETQTAIGSWGALSFKWMTRWRHTLKFDNISDGISPKRNPTRVRNLRKRIQSGVPMTSSGSQRESSVRWWFIVGDNSSPPASISPEMMLNQKNLLFVIKMIKMHH